MPHLASLLRLPVILQAFEAVVRGRRLREARGKIDACGAVRVARLRRSWTETRPQAPEQDIAEPDNAGAIEGDRFREKALASLEQAFDLLCANRVSLKTYASMIAQEHEEALRLRDRALAAGLGGARYDEAVADIEWCLAWARERGTEPPAGDNPAQLDLPQGRLDRLDRESLTF